MKKACILAAGFGSRLNFSKFSNKALLPVGNRAAISIIMDSIPLDVEIVIAVNYMKEDLIDYLELVEVERKIEFIEVSRISGPGSGPGLSLMECEKALQEPFVLFACDSIPLSKINFSLDHNWIATSKEIETLNYLNVSGDTKGNVNDFYDKIKLNWETIEKEKISSFSGIAGIYDYKVFFQGLKEASAANSESQVMPGFKRLMEKKLRIIDNFSWADVGEQEKFEKYEKEVNHSAQIEKENEYIYFEKNRTVKFYSMESKAQNMNSRLKYLNGVNPPDVKVKGRFLTHKFVVGTLLSELNEKNAMVNFLDFINDKLWKVSGMSDPQQNQLGIVFYKDKTQERVNLMLKNINLEQGQTNINGIQIPSLCDQLKNIDWNNLCTFSQSYFHGDPQPENVIYDNNEWTLIDWRDNFGGQVDFGDKYYDLAKIYHALIVSGQSVRRGKFEVNILKNNEILIKIFIQHNHRIMINEFERWISWNGIDLLKIRELSALILLNIAPLHKKDYGIFLYYYGRYLLELNSRRDWIKIVE